MSDELEAIEDCYFYQDEEKIKTLCTKCGRKISKPDAEKLGLWFWEGSMYGYGPFLFKCCRCDKIIYEETTPDD